MKQPNIPNMYKSTRVITAIISIHNSKVITTTYIGFREVIAFYRYEHCTRNKNIHKIRKRMKEGKNKFEE